MKRIAFKMKISKNQAADYKLRHDQIWPDLKSLLKRTGICDYSIFLDEETGDLFGYLLIEDPLSMESLRTEPLMWKWWEYMQDIMETNADHSPISRPLKEVFHLP